MSNIAFYQFTPDEISRCQKTLGTLKKDLADTETMWLELHDALEPSEH
jgi:hypothetical protein